MLSPTAITIILAVIWGIAVIGLVAVFLFLIKKNTLTDIDCDGLKHEAEQKMLIGYKIYVALEWFALIFDFFTLSAFAFLPKVPWFGSIMHWISKALLFNFDEGYPIWWLVIVLWATLVCVLVLVFPRNILLKSVAVVTLDIFSVPYFFTFASVFYCTYKTENSITYSVLDNDPNTVCWKPIHISLVFFTILLGGVYLAVSFLIIKDRLPSRTFGSILSIMLARFLLSVLASSLRDQLIAFFVLYGLIILSILFYYSLFQPFRPRGYYECGIKIGVLSCVLWTWIWGCIVLGMNDRTVYWPLIVYLIGIAPVFICAFYINSKWYRETTLMWGEYRQDIPRESIEILVYHDDSYVRQLSKQVLKRVNPKTLSFSLWDAYINANDSKIKHEMLDLLISIKKIDNAIAESIIDRLEDEVDSPTFHLLITVLYKADNSVIVENFEKLKPIIIHLIKEKQMIPALHFAKVFSEKLIAQIDEDSDILSAIFDHFKQYGTTDPHELVYDFINLTNFWNNTPIYDRYHVREIMDTLDTDGYCDEKNYLSYIMRL